MKWLEDTTSLAVARDPCQLPTDALSCQLPPCPTNCRLILPTAALSYQLPQYFANCRHIILTAALSYHEPGHRPAGGAVRDEGHDQLEDASPVAVALSLRVEARCQTTWKRESKIPWREAGSPYHHEDSVDSDQ